MTSGQTMRPDPIRADALGEAKAARHAFFTRQGGVSGGLYGSLNIGLGSSDRREDVLKNRARAMAHLALPEERLVTLYQIHSAEVATVTEPWRPEDAPRADGVVTDRPGVALGIATADCAPVLFCDPDARVIGACHAGWKGALGGVVENTVAAMERLGADRRRIAAAVGPCIAQHSYEVGAEFRQAFLDADSAHERFFAAGARPEKYQFDLPGFVCDRLAAAELGQSGWTGHDTREDPERFFSYRRATLAGEADYGRLLSAIVLN